MSYGNTLEGHLIQSCEPWKAPWRKVIDVQVRLEAQGGVNLEQREQRVGQLRDTDGCQSRVRSRSGKRGIVFYLPWQGIWT